jgi:predicted NAD/FAD-binding protein
MSLAVSLHQGGFEYSGSDTFGFFGQVSNLLNPRHWKLLFELLAFNKQAKKALANPDQLAELTMQDFLNHHGFSDILTQRYVLPMAGAIWSCPKEAILKFNALAMLRFYENHGLLNIQDRPQWYTVKNGARTYIQKILEQAHLDIHLSEAVQQVIPQKDGIQLITAKGEYTFDQVIFACHSDQAHALLNNPVFAPLADLRYQPNTAYLHSDRAWLPKREKLWASWNYVQRSESDADDQPITVTYWMNGLQDLPTQQPINVTLNPPKGFEPRDPMQVIDYAHPLFDARTPQVQQSIEALQGQYPLWFCGAYLGSGFHEDGLRSSVNLARRWGLTLPWEMDTAAASETDHD